MLFSGIFQKIAMNPKDEERSESSSVDEEEFLLTYSNSEPESEESEICEEVLESKELNDDKSPSDSEEEDDTIVKWYTHPESS